MSDFESKPAAATPNNWEAQCAALQRQVSILFLALFVVSGTLSIFLWRQNRIAGMQLENAQRAVQPSLVRYKQEQKAQFEGFELKLAEWARTHPDFARYLAGFNIQLQATPAPAAPKK